MYACIPTAGILINAKELIFHRQLFTKLVALFLFFIIVIIIIFIMALVPTHFNKEFNTNIITFFMYLVYNMQHCKQGKLNNKSQVTAE